MSNSSDNGSSSPPSSPCCPEQTFPYVIGKTFTAQRHLPSAPFGGYYSQCESSDQDDLECTSQMEWCLAHPPSEGITDIDNTYTFGIRSTIRTGENCGSQLVLTDTGLVAKIYDPLFYPYQHGEFPERKVDVSYCADSEYTVETVAYSELEGSHVQDSVMPKYHGSWTINVATVMQDEHIARPVRMILMEHIQGIAMIDIDPENVTPEERENIMVKIMEADYDLRYAGVEHLDLSPRNIIISSSSGLADPLLRVVFIDFGVSLVTRIQFGGLPPDELRNPLFSWAWPSRWSLYGWWPPCGEDSTRRLWALFGDGRGGKYVKVERDPKSKTGKPVDIL